MGHRIALAFACTLVFAAAGCDSTRIHLGNPDEKVVSKEEYVETPAIDGVGLDQLWERAQAVLGMQGYEIDEKRSRYADRLTVTHWREQLSTARFEGFRTRAWVRFREAKPAGWIVGVAVQRQRNEDIDHPTEPTAAKWEESPNEMSHNAAGVILWKVEAGFRQPGADVETPTK